MEKSEWESGVTHELAFWKHWLETKGAQWPEDFAMRADPNSPLQDEIARHVPHDFGAPLKVLDVGAGPMSWVGKIFRGAPIELTAVDALADLYGQLNFPLGLPIVRTQKCDSEALSSKFSKNYFDVVFSRNALDHGYDPLRALLEMVAVARPRGIVVTMNWPNEAIRENWTGFHQWNFSVHERRFIISNKCESFDVQDLVGHEADTIHLSNAASQIVYCVLNKRDEKKSRALQSTKE